MAVDAFLDFQQSKIKIEGETQDKQFPKCMHITQFEFTVTQEGSSGTAGGSGSGKANFEDFSFTKVTDMASPQLMLHCAKGTHFDKVLLHVRKAGGGQQEFLTVRFENCLISNYAVTGEEQSTENIKFNYTAMFIAYRPQKADGSLGAVSKGGYDLKRNAELTV